MHLPSKFYDYKYVLACLAWAGGTSSCPNCVPSAPSVGGFLSASGSYPASQLWSGHCCSSLGASLYPYLEKSLHCVLVKLIYLQLVLYVFFTPGWVLSRFFFFFSLSQRRRRLSSGQQICAGLSDSCGQRVLSLPPPTEAGERHRLPLDLQG